MTSRARKLVNLLERLLKQDHLYSSEKIREMKSQLRLIKKEISQVEEKTSKGFGK